MNGEFNNSQTITIDPTTTPSTYFQVGRSGFPNFPNFYNGAYDEFVVFDRGLPPDEIEDMYLRGAARLELQVRSCDDAACAGEDFVGPGGSTGAYFSELTSGTSGFPSASLSGVVSDNRYFQYQLNFETDDSVATPEVVNVTAEAEESSVAVPEFPELILWSILVILIIYTINKRIRLKKYA